MNKPNYILKSGIKLKQFTIVQFLKSGGFGNTYLATTPNGTHVVIKEYYPKGICNRASDGLYVVINNDDNKKNYESQKQKLIKEAQRLKSLSHTNIVRVSDWFEANGTAYYVMDYIKGVSLKDLINQQGKPFSEKDALDYLNQILSAVEYIHSKGILHLDIKPSNIMIDDKNTPILIDFGASKIFDTTSENFSIFTTSSIMAYTQGYAPIEQVLGEKKRIGTHSDIYALGATLYFMLTGTTPPSPSTINDEGLKYNEKIPPIIFDTIVNAMQPKAKDRIQSIEIFRAMLYGDTLPHKPILPPSPPPHYPAAKEHNSNNDEKTPKPISNRSFLYIAIAVTFVVLLIITLISIRKNENSDYSEARRQDSINQAYTEQLRIDSINKVHAEQIKQARIDSINQIKQDSAGCVRFAARHLTNRIEGGIEWDSPQDLDTRLAQLLASYSTDMSEAENPYDGPLRGSGIWHIGHESYSPNLKLQSYKTYEHNGYNIYHLKFKLYYGKELVSFGLGGESIKEVKVIKEDGSFKIYDIKTDDASLSDSQWVRETLSLYY